MWKRHVIETGSAIVVSLALFGCGGADDTLAPMGSGGSAGAGGGSGGAPTTGGGAGNVSAGSAGTAGAAGEGGGVDGAGPPETSMDVADTGRDCGPCGPLDRPSVPPAIDPPAAAMLVARYHAHGDQVYTCSGGSADSGADAAAVYAWVLKAPQATLEDALCVDKGTHFAGPTWQALDGSSVVGSRLASAPSPNMNSIPQLLLMAIRNAGEGIFANVTFVQRLDTHDGNAPADGCSVATAGMETRSSYTATYYFYAGSASSDGGAEANGADAAHD